MARRGSVSGGVRGGDGKKASVTEPLLVKGGGGGGTSQVDKLADLQAARDLGRLTEGEFTHAKQGILASHAGSGRGG